MNFVEGDDAFNDSDEGPQAVALEPVATEEPLEGDLGPAAAVVGSP